MASFQAKIDWKRQRKRKNLKNLKNLKNTITAKFLAKIGCERFRK